MSLLEVKGLKISYGGINAVKGIDLSVQEGEMVALIGANGAGKTTTLKAICGLLPPAAGGFFYRGEDVTGAPSYALVERGLALVPEGRQVFGRLTAEENLEMGAYARRDGAASRPICSACTSCSRACTSVAGRPQARCRAASSRCWRSAARLMSAPKLLLLDEPSMGLAPLMVQRIFETIRKVASEGVTVLLVEQNAKLALELSQRAM